MAKKSGRGDYDVGYGRTPEHTRWQKGQSGNPTGKRSGAPSFKTAIRRELEAQIAISDNGAHLEVTKMEALAKRLVAEALSGKPRMLTELLRQINIHLSDPGTGDASLPATEEDAALLLDYVRRVNGQDETANRKSENEPPSDDF